MISSVQLYRFVVGALMLLSLLSGIPGSPLFVSAWWLALATLAGANLLQNVSTPSHPARSVVRTHDFKSRR